MKFSDVKDAYNRNLLFVAAEFPDMVVLLLKAGVNINEVENVDGNSPLTYAASKNFKSTVMTLIDKGADVNHVNSYGFTALHYAVKYNQVDIVKAIIKVESADFKIENKEKLNPLSMALKLNMTNIYELIAEELNRREEVALKEGLERNNLKKIQVGLEDDYSLIVDNQHGFSFNERNFDKRNMITSPKNSKNSF